MKIRLMLATALLLGSALAGFSQYKENDWEERYDWQNIPGILEAMNIKSGSIVADVGCHEGFLTIPLAKAVGSNGKVYAVDIESYRLNKLKSHLTERDLRNVETVLGEGDNPKLPLNTLDAVVILDAYHEMSEHQSVLRHIAKSLKPNGRLVIIDEIEDKHKNSSRSQQMSTHNLDLRYALKDLVNAGYKIEREQAVFVKWENKEHIAMWLIVAVK